jgi:alcohol dehydrogenase (cytochrome c)
MGISGGEYGVQGFVAGYSVLTGQTLWTVWTAPNPGDPAASTWVGNVLPHGGGTTWMTGTYDAVNNILYWTSGNAAPDFDGDGRIGDNLYTASVLAIQPLTGQMLWYFQFTPHAVFDFDAEEPPMLVDALFQGQPRNLLLQTNRNGFFYVLDRLTGQFLQATPFVTNLTWASGIGTDGRPILIPGATPSPSGTTICPSRVGGTNWMSNAFNPATGLYYVMADETCGVYYEFPTSFQPGVADEGGFGAAGPAVKHVRALNLQTGSIAWDNTLTGPGLTFSGVLSTASGLVFYGDDNGNFTAVDAASGSPVWTYATQQQWQASPMTYMVNGTQYVAIAAPGQLMVFALSSL